MKKINYIALVIDKSGSMGHIRKQTINSINEQLDVLQDAEDNQDDRVTVVTFNNKVDEPRFFNLNERFAEEDYDPRGGTSLFDAIGRTVEMFQDVKVNEDEDVAYLLVVVSDGEENTSKEYTAEQISSIIKELEGQGNWTFTFIGADKNCLDRVRDIGIGLSNSTSFTASAYGMGVASSGMACGLMSYKNARGDGSKQVGNFYAGSAENL
jgi:uncharacterized protein YegL